mmetsp:Transcript_12090/g.33048  ORF Transcript_12090/g.33048 Transcript_12090/m.33048 type:complete len:92 (-) Transcript_12090:3123-3398(-)
MPTRMWMFPSSGLLGQISSLLAASRHPNANSAMRHTQVCIAHSLNFEQTQLLCQGIEPRVQAVQHVHDLWWLKTGADVGVAAHITEEERDL